MLIVLILLLIYMLVFLIFLKQTDSFSHYYTLFSSHKEHYPEGPHGIQ
jgi:hypothetical protein